MRNFAAYWLCLPALMGLLSSCTREDAGSSGEDGTVQVFFTLAIDGGTKTRTTWGDDYDKEEATAWENSIAGGLQVILYNWNYGNSYDYDYDDEPEFITAKGENFTISPVEGSDGKEYDVICAIPVKYIDYSRRYRLVVLANSPECDITGISSADTPWNSLSFKAGAISYDTENNSISGGHIPMWGTQKYNAYSYWSQTDPPHLMLEEGERTDAGTICLLRAMSKIAVRLDDFSISRGFSLSGVTIDKYNTEGYVAPMGQDNEPGNVDATTDVVIEGEETPGLNVNGSAEENALPFIRQGDEWVVYIPEMEQEDAKNANIVLSITKDGTTVERSFTLDNYVNGAAAGSGIDIIRNTVYDYTVVIGTTDLEVTLKMMPWSIYSSQVSYSSSHQLYAWNGAEASLYEAGSNMTAEEKEKSVYYNGCLGDMEAVHSFVCYPSPVISEADQYDDSMTPSEVRDTSSNADFWFTLKGTSGKVMWKAALSNEDCFEFDTGRKWTDADGKTRYSAAAGVSRDEPYMISVRARKPWYKLTDGKTTDSFSNSSGWTNTADGYDWEDSGTAPYTDLNIKVSTDGSTWENLSINEVSTGMVASHHTSGMVTDDSGMTVRAWRRFAGGQFYIRIWQLKAEGDSNGNWIGWHDTAEKNKTADTEYINPTGGGE